MIFHMATMLNLINHIPDSMAEYLRDVDTDEHTNERRMDLFISYNGMLITFGYCNDSLVWFSCTSLSDGFNSRRIFECMRQGVFYRRVKYEDVLAYANVTEKDIGFMYHISLDNVQTDTPLFSYDISLPSPPTGLDFANTMMSVFIHLTNLGKDLGSDNDILIELSKDQQYANALYNNGLGFDDKRRLQLIDIYNKWQKRSFLTLSNRASIRSAYYDICEFCKKII